MASNHASRAAAAARNLAFALCVDEADVVLQVLSEFDGTLLLNNDLLQPFHPKDTDKGECNYDEDSDTEEDEFHHDADASLNRLRLLLQNIVKAYKQLDSNQHELMFRVLLTHDEADMYTVTLAVAAEFGCINTVTMLMSHETLSSQLDPGFNQQFALRRASCHGYVDIVKLLLCDPRVDPAVLDNAALVAACENGHAPVVKLLLADPRVDVAANGNCAFRVACRAGQLETVQVLLADHRVAPASLNDYGFRAACSQGHEGIVKLLLSDHRVDPLVDNCDALHSASFNGHLGVVKLLLADDRFDPAAGHVYVATYCATANGHAELLEWLMSHAIGMPAHNVREADKSDVIDLDDLLFPHGMERLISVVARQLYHLSDLLKLCRCNHEGALFMAFQLACQRGHVDVVKLLVRTARYTACETGAIAAVRFGQGAVLEALLPHLDDGVVDACFHAELSRYHPTTEQALEPAKLLMSRGEMLRSVCGEGYHRDAMLESVGLMKAIHKVEVEAAFLLLLCVKRNFSNSVAARVGDVLREVCDKWTHLLQGRD
jgi:ankyrin repeat protein